MTRRTLFRRLGAFAAATCIGVSLRVQSPVYEIDWDDVSDKFKEALVACIDEYFIERSGYFDSMIFRPRPTEE